jgi:dienelactone hydrolase
MGGGYTYLAATSGAVDLAVPFYGAASPSTSAPRVAFFGGNDEWIPRADVAQVEQHHPGDVVVYEDAQHGFMRDGSDTYHETAAPEAWQRMLAFFDLHLREQ